MAGWTLEEDGVIRRHVKTHSATQIAALLPGRSRASVIGRAWRLGESLAKDEVTRRELEHPRRRGLQRVPSAPTPPADDPRSWPAASLRARRAALTVQPRLAPMAALKPGECRWPYGEAELRFCGQPVTTASPYCAGHHGLAYVPDPAPYDPEVIAKVIDRREGRVVGSAA
jgi:hypothetical protein